MSTYEIAFNLAKEAHKGQTRWNKDPYFTHLERVAANFPLPRFEEQKIVAILHDGWEDQPNKINPSILRNMGFSEKIINAVSLITKKNDQSYADYILGLRNNYLARQVKMADLQDNMQDLKKSSMLDKYQLAYAILLEYENET